jgi:hypothetical protein
MLVVEPSACGSTVRHSTRRTGSVMMSSYDGLPVSVFPAQYSMPLQTLPNATEEEIPPRLFGSTSVMCAIRGFHRRSNRTRSQESAQTDCTSTYSKMGATCKRICKWMHQSSDIASNQSLHPRFPSPSFQNEQESPMAPWRRPRTL